MEFGGRLYLARGEVSDVASAAARAATLASDSSGAVRAAHRTVAEQLGDTCASSPSGNGMRVDVDAAEFGRPAGTRAQVRVSVHCDLRFDDLLLPGMPGQLTVSATGAHTLDSFRQRTTDR